MYVELIAKLLGCMRAFVDFKADELVARAGK